MIDQKKRELHEERRWKTVMRKAAMRKAAKISNGADSSHGAGSLTGAGSSTGEQPHTAPKPSTWESMKTLLQDVHEKSENLGSYWGSRNEEASTLNDSTQPGGGGSASGAALTMGSRTEGKRKGKGKGKEEQQLCSNLLTSRYAAKDKGEGKAPYPDVSNTEEVIGTETVENGNIESLAYPHASDSRGVPSGSTLGHRNGLDEWSQTQSHRQATTESRSAEGSASCWSPSLSDTSLLELEPIDSLD